MQIEIPLITPLAVKYFNKASSNEQQEYYRALYFKKHGFEAQGVAWMPTAFSTLPPSYRVLILEKYYVTNPTKFVIDKLSIAYLKNREEEKARTFLKICFENGEIDKGLYEYYDSNLTMFENAFRKNIKRFSIANNLDEAKSNFDKLLPSITEGDRNSFIVLLSMILNTEL